MRLAIYIIGFVFLFGCSHKKELLTKYIPSVPINFQLFDYQTIDIISEQELFYLSPKQQQQFLTYFNKAIANGTADHEAISDYLLSHLSGFNYYGKTNTASQTMDTMQGNCMSLAILTTALARLVEVEVGFREVNTLPIFEKKDDLILSSNHVQTKLFHKITNEQGRFNIFNRRGILVDYFPNNTNVKSRYLKFNQFIAMYYKNVASSALVDGDLDKAFAYAHQALKYDNTSNGVINLLGVIHRRIGDEITAERIYQAAMKSNNVSLSVLSNYAALLERQDRFNEASSIQQQMAKLNDPNPYSWLEQAYLEQSRGREQQAISYFKKTVRLAPYVKPAYVGLYNVYMKQGKEQLAKKTIANALEWTHAPDERKQLKYKLYGRNHAVEAMEFIQ